MNPTAVIALANLQRRRRWDTEPRAPVINVGRTRRALAGDGLPIDRLTAEGLAGLARLADAVSEVGNSFALRRPPTSRAIEVINEQASACTGTSRLSVRRGVVLSDVYWRDPDPIAGLARRVIEELGAIDPSRIRQCQRAECDLLFFDATRSRSQRWHAENPCGWLERQHRRRAHH